MSLVPYFLHYLHHQAMTFSGVLDHYGLAIVIIALFLESAGVIFLPGETLLICGGFLAGQGAFNPFILFGFGIFATCMGWFAAYYMGYKVGLRWLKTNGKWIGITAERLQKTHRFLNKYGSIVVLFGRFIVPLRQLQGYISGSAETTFHDFYLWNILGSILWVAFWGGAGYFIGLI